MRIGTYELIGPVGSGSTGTVWKAHDPQLDRPVALKRLDNPTDELRQLWRGEARLLATMSDPHIVEVYGYVENDDSAYIVEQWVEGATLSAVLSHAGKLATDQALGVVRGALLGLAHAHERNVVHRDVSPNNVLVDQGGTSRLIDFGLAGPAGSLGSSGTAAYRSPEATSNQPVTSASDVYSAAAVLTHLLTGTAAEPPAPGGIDPGLRGVVRRALETDPAKRYPDAGAFLAALEEAAERRYGAAWWSQAGMTGLVGGTGVAVVTAVAGGLGSATAPAATLAAGGAAPAGVAGASPAASINTGRALGKIFQGARRSTRLLTIGGTTAAVTVASVAAALVLSRPAAGADLAGPWTITFTVTDRQTAGEAVGERVDNSWTFRRACAGKDCDTILNVPSFSGRSDVVLTKAGDSYSGTLRQVQDCLDTEGTVLEKDFGTTTDIIRFKVTDSGDGKAGGIRGTVVEDFVRAAGKTKCSVSPDVHSESTIVGQRKP